MPFYSVHGAAACLCAVLLLLPAPAQVPASRPAAGGQGQAEQSAPPVLRVTTRMVQVNVIVQGRNSQPVAGLSKDDFEIIDGGVRQQVAVFSVESTLPAATVPGGTLPPARVPNLFSNLPAYNPTAPNAVTVILMDGLNTAFAEQAYARQQLIQFLHTLTPNDRVALYTLGRELRILHDFTDDPAVLLKALDRHRGHTGPELADSLPEESDTGNEELDAFLDQSNQAIADFQTRNRVRTTLNAIEAISGHLAALPGRKNLVWISSGFPFSIGMDEMNLDSSADRQVFSDDLEDAARAVNSASLAIYPVDARGLAGNPDYHASVRGSRNVRRPPPPQSKGMRNIQNTHDTMEILARRTGGKAYYNTNDLKSAIRGAIDDSRLTYVLGYYPTHNAWDGKFREIKVRVKRPGVDVRHRPGYFAFAEPVRNEQARKSELAEAARNPLDSTGVGLKVRLGPDVPRAGVLRALVSVEGGNLTLVREGERWTGAVDVLFILQAAPDKPPTSHSRTMNLQLTRATYDTIMKRGLILARDFNYDEARYGLKVVVRDVPSGNVGSVNVRTSRLAPVELSETAAPAPEP